MFLRAMVNLAALEVSRWMKEERGMGGYCGLAVSPVSCYLIIITSLKVMLLPLIHKEES